MILLEHFQRTHHIFLNVVTTWLVIALSPRRFVPFFFKIAYVLNLNEYFQ